MKLNLIPNAEAAMFYSEGPSDNRCIGHLRIDFGSGEEFYSTWWQHSAEALKTANFRKEFDDLVNTLRKSLLKGFSGMRKYLSEHPAPKLSEDSFGYRVETACFEYYIRCMPLRGNYNCYIYCYVRNRGEKKR